MSSSVLLWLLGKSWSHCYVAGGDLLVSSCAEHAELEAPCFQNKETLLLVLTGCCV